MGDVLEGLLKKQYRALVKKNISEMGTKEEDLSVREGGVKTSQRVESGVGTIIEGLSGGPKF